MKNLILPALLFALFSDLYSQQTVKLSLDEAVAFATEHQPAFQNYLLDLQIAAAKNLEAASKYLPKLNGTFDLRDNLKLGQVALKIPNAITGQEQDLKVTQGTKYFSSAGVDLSQPILDMNAVNDIKVAKEQKHLTEFQLQQALIDLKINVSRSYYLVLLNKERVAKAEKSVSRFKQAYDDAKVKFDNQNATKTELNRAFLNLSNAQYQLKVSEDSVKTSSVSLSQIIGLPANTVVELTGDLPSEIKAEALPEYPDYKNAEESRVELKAENEQKFLNQLQLRKINYQYIPTISGYGFIGGQGLDNGNIFQEEKWFWNSYIGLRVNVPIFDGLQKVALASQQKFSIKKNENNIASIRNTINYQLQNSLVNYANASKNLELIEANVQLAEEVVADVNTRYKNSLATLQEVLDSENTLKETEFNYMQAMYVFLMAELDWKKANGKL